MKTLFEFKEIRFNPSFRLFLDRSAIGLSVGPQKLRILFAFMVSHIKGCWSMCLGKQRMEAFTGHVFQVSNGIFNDRVAIASVKLPSCGKCPRQKLNFEAFVQKLNLKRPYISHNENRNDNKSPRVVAIMDRGFIQF